jgi:predicted dehydrogenase
MIQSAKQHGTKLEVNENYYRAPSERIKREMILAGVFGKVNAAYNEFRGHGYHRIGLIHMLASTMNRFESSASARVTRYRSTSSAKVS